LNDLCGAILFFLDRKPYYTEPAYNCCYQSKKLITCYWVNELLLGRVIVTDKVVSKIETKA